MSSRATVDVEMETAAKKLSKEKEHPFRTFHFVILEIPSQVKWKKSTCGGKLKPNFQGVKKLKRTRKIKQ